MVELLERAAKIYLLARTVGEPDDLPEDALETQVMIYDYKRSLNDEED